MSNLFNDRLRTLAAWCHKRAEGDHDRQTTITMLYRKVRSLGELHKMSHARAVYGPGVRLKECPSCLGHGWYVMSAGDCDSREECEACKETGYVPDTSDRHRTRVLDDVESSECPTKPLSTAESESTPGPEPA